MMSYVEWHVECSSWFLKCVFHLLCTVYTVKTLEKTKTFSTKRHSLECISLPSEVIWTLLILLLLLCLPLLLIFGLHKWHSHSNKGWSYRIRLDSLDGPSQLDAKILKISFIQTEFCPFCFKFRCNSNREQSVVNISDITNRLTHCDIIPRCCCTAVVPWHYVLQQWRHAYWVTDVHRETDRQKKQLLHLHQCSLRSPWWR